MFQVGQQAADVVGVAVLTGLRLALDLLHHNVSPDDCPRHCAQLLLADGLQYLGRFHSRGEFTGRFEGGPGVGREADLSGDVDGDVVPGGNVREVRVGGVPGRGDVGVVDVDDHQRRTGDGLDGLRVVAHQVRHENLPGPAPLQVERDEGRLRPRFVDRHEIPGPHPAEQLGQVIVGNLEVFRHVHTPELRSHQQDGSAGDVVAQQFRLVGLAGRTLESQQLGVDAAGGGQFGG